MSATDVSQRELEILHGMAAGKTNAEIGRQLHITEDTVKTHLRRLFRKIGARNRHHAVALAYERGLIVGHRSVGECFQNAARVRAVNAWLDECSSLRSHVAAGSRFAVLYDGLAKRLTDGTG